MAEEMAGGGEGVETALEGSSGGGAPSGGGGAPGAPGEGGGRPEWLLEGYDSPEAQARAMYDQREEIENARDVYKRFHGLWQQPNMRDVIEHLYQHGRLPEQQQPQQQPQGRRETAAEKRERYAYYDRNNPEARSRYFEEQFGADPGILPLTSLREDEDYRDELRQYILSVVGGHPTMGKIHAAAFKSTYANEIAGLHPAAKKWFDQGQVSEDRLSQAIALSNDITANSPRQPAPRAPSPAPANAANARAGAGRGNAGGGGKKTIPPGSPSSAYIEMVDS